MPCAPRLPKLNQGNIRPNSLPRKLKLLDTLKYLEPPDTPHAQVKMAKKNDTTTVVAEEYRAFGISTRRKLLIAGYRPSIKPIVTVRNRDDLAA